MKTRLFAVWITLLLPGLIIWVVDNPKIAVTIGAVWNATLVVIIFALWSNLITNYKLHKEWVESQINALLRTFTGVSTVGTKKPTKLKMDGDELE